jgi:hypothetical protein
MTLNLLVKLCKRHFYLKYCHYSASCPKKLIGKYDIVYAIIWLRNLSLTIKSKNVFFLFDYCECM